MLGLVFGIIGTIVFIVARTIRREERERARREAARREEEQEKPRPTVPSR